MGKLQEFYDKRYEKGLCIYCGEKPYTEGKKTCQSCRDKKRKPKNTLKKITIDGEPITDEELMYGSEFLLCGKKY